MGISICQQNCFWLNSNTCSGNLAVSKLIGESQELSKIIKACPDAGNGDNWTFDDVNRAVIETQKVYETKRRLLSGRPQKVYHDVMCNLDAHSGVLNMIPQSNTYVSLVAGAIKTLVKVISSMLYSHLSYQNLC